MGPVVLHVGAQNSRGHDNRKFLEQVSQMMKFHCRTKATVQNCRSVGTPQMRSDVKVAEVPNSRSAK